MKIWKLSFEYDKYDSLIPVKEWNAEFIRSFDGRTHSADWKPVSVERTDRKKRELSDAPGFTIPMFSERSKRILTPLIAENVEFLPLDFSEGKYYIVNTITVLDAVNYEEAIYERFRSSGRIMRFIKYVFLPDVIENTNIFKITDEPLGYEFVSDIFKETVEKNNLSGFKFELVWDSGQNTKIQ